MKELNIGNIKPEKWNNIPMCICDGFKVVINDNIRLDEKNIELNQNLDEFKKINDMKVKKITVDIKKNYEDSLNQINKNSKNIDTYIIQIKEQIKRDKEVTISNIDEKLAEVKDRLWQINDMIEKSEESKRVLAIVKTMFKDFDSKLDNRFGNFENSFSEFLIKNIQVRRIIGYSCHFPNYVDYLTWIYDNIVDIKTKFDEHDVILQDLNEKFKDMKQSNIEEKERNEEMFEKLENETITNKTKPLIESVNQKLEEQKIYFNNLIEPISDQLCRFDMIDENIQLNSKEFKHEISKLYNVLDDVSRKDLKKVEDRATKLEEAINKLQQQQIEKFNKLETEFKSNINNIESKNMDIMNQAQNLNDKLHNIEQKSQYEPSSTRYYTETKEDKRTNENVGMKREDDGIVSNDPEMSKDFKKEVLDLISTRLNEYKIEFDLNQENLNKDFMIMKRNTVDEVLKNVELNQYPLTDEVEQAILQIISMRLERSLSAPSRIGIKVYNNMTTNPEYQSNMHTLASIEKSKEIKNYNSIFKDRNDLSENFARITTRNIKHHPDKTVSSVSRTMASTAMKWNQKSYIASKQYSQDDTEYIQEIQVISNLSGASKDSIQNNISNKHYGNYYNTEDYYDKYIETTNRFNKPATSNVSSIKVNVSQDASIEHTSNVNDLCSFVEYAGDDIPRDKPRKYERLFQYEKKFEGKVMRDLLKNQTRKEKMYRNLVALMNEPYNLRTIMKMDTFKMGVWDVNYCDPSKYNPYDGFKRKTEINFDVNYFFKVEHKDEVESEEGPKKIFQYGGKNYKHMVVKKE